MESAIHAAPPSVHPTHPSTPPAHPSPSPTPDASEISSDHIASTTSLEQELPTATKINSDVVALDTTTTVELGSSNPNSSAPISQQVDSAEGTQDDNVAAVTATSLPESPVQPQPTSEAEPARYTTQESQPGDPLPELPIDVELPKPTSLHLFPEQLKHPLFVAIAKVLVVHGNVWQSSTDLVDGIRHFNLASLGGRTPKGTIQGAISTALSLSHTLKTFEPIEKCRMNSTTYYRMAPRALEPSLHDVAMDSEATESDSAVAAARKARPISAPAGGSSKGQSAASKARSKSTSTTTTVSKNAKRKPRPSTAVNSDAGTRRKKRKPISGWRSDTLSSDSSEDDTREHGSNGRHHTSNHNHRQTTVTSKRNLAGSSLASTSSRSKVITRRDSLPNGLKKLPKGYVYDTEFNQAALMHLSVNPSQTGEYMRQLKGKNAQENDFPDKRSEYGVDLHQEPSLFALEQQTGYTYPRLRTSRRERLPKGDCEDGYAISDLKHNGAFLGRLFCITDGHGGRACSSFVIATIPGAMQVILGKYKPADLSLPSVQELVKVQITEAIRLIDKEYLDYKKQQYLLYKSKQIPNDPGSDGTTLIVNIFIDKWIICLNLGDSRTMLGSRDSTGRWNADFYSEDHTPSLERLAQTIHANGGEFVTHDDKVIRFDPNLRNDKKHRQSLKEARIRVKDAASNPYGIPYMTKNGHCASVNLGACIGDVLYKLDPVNPVLGCKPDITFIDITNIQQGFLLMASDGLWDYVQRGGKVQDQNASVCQFVGDKLERGWNHQRIVYSLSDRESATGLYSDSIQEYDDFTAILVTFDKQQLLRQQQQQRDCEQQQALLHQQRLQEQQILQLQQQHQRQRELERLQRLQQLQIQKEQAEMEQLQREQESLQRKAEGNWSENDTDSDLTEPEPDLETMTSRPSRKYAPTKADSALLATTMTTERESLLDPVKEDVRMVAFKQEGMTYSSPKHEPVASSDS